jgi:hypothetical protein
MGLYLRTISTFNKFSGTRRNYDKPNLRRREEENFTRRIMDQEIRNYTISK